MTLLEGVESASALLITGRLFVEIQRHHRVEGTVITEDQPREDGIILAELSAQRAIYAVIGFKFFAEQISLINLDITEQVLLPHIIFNILSYFAVAYINNI